MKRESAADDQAVAALNTRAAEKRRDARTIYQQAVDDSEGGGVTRKAGCPAGGYCDRLVKRSRALDDQAAALDKPAAQLQVTQRTDRAARASEAAQLTSMVADQRGRNAAAVQADAGFGARTKAMWWLVTSDFWGIGVFYLGIALLLVALDCAAVGLKFVSHGNAYERAEARKARNQEHDALIAYQRGVEDARTYGEALAQLASDRARSVLHSALDPRPHPEPQPENLDAVRT